MASISSIYATLRMKSMKMKHSRIKTPHATSIGNDDLMVPFLPFPEADQGLERS